MGLRIGIVGGTGNVGRKILEVLEERNIDIEELSIFASKKSKGKTIRALNKDVVIEELNKENMERKFDFLLFAVESDISKVYGKIAADSGNIVIDNSSYFRMKEGVPLIIPEINENLLKNYKGIIANPNCSTIQMLIAINPLNKINKVKKVNVSTYQAVSGSGQKGLDQLIEESNTIEEDFFFKKNLRPLKTKVNTKVYKEQIAFNCIPHIDDFLENGYTKEEMKMVNETEKILGGISVNPTTVRVPVLNGHSESITIEFENEIRLKDVFHAYENRKDIEVIDGINNYPTVIDAVNSDKVFIGRIRKDLNSDNIINLWVVTDNLRKGAASNAVDILDSYRRLNK